MRRLGLLIVLATTCAAAGCTMASRHIRDAGGSDGDGDVDADWCELRRIERSGSNQVDLLLVVDNTGSMHEEQVVLADQMVVILRELIDPAPGPDGSRPPAVDDLHVGVVSTDMGTGGYTIMTCRDPVDGDAGELITQGRYEGCEGEYSADECDRDECPWLDHSTELPDDGSVPGDPPIWDDLACISRLGTGGCGFEQPLEASLWALTRQTEPGRRNEGFLRESSVLAVVYVTDEDDCSSADPDFFDPEDEDLAPLNVRCALDEEHLHPISRYVDGLLGLRPGREDLVVVAVIAGVPVDGSWSPGEPIEALRELRQLNPARPTELLPTCETAMGLAWPPVRLVELVYAFGPSSVLASICRADWTAALSAVERGIQLRLSGTCLVGEAPDVAGGDCRLVETLADDGPCPHPAEGTGPDRGEGWQVDLGLDASGRRECLILPADTDGDGCPEGSCYCGGPNYDGCLQGWFLRSDAAPCPGGRIQLTSADVLSDLGEARFECRLASCPSG